MKKNLGCNIIYTFRNILYRNRMWFLQKLGNAVRSCDVFCSSKFFRYNQEKQYETFTGGLTSLVILIVIAISFSANIIDTFQKVNITYDKVVQYIPEPPHSVLYLNQTANFMFGFSIVPTNEQLMISASQIVRYFKIQFKQFEFKGTEFLLAEKKQIQRCSKAHWSRFSDIMEKFQILQMQEWFCPQLNSSYSIQGYYSSTNLSYIGVDVSLCKNQTNSTGECAPQQQIDQIFRQAGNFYFNLFFLNPLINPALPTYIKYYLDPSVYTIFSKTLGGQTEVMFSDYTISSDNSIWPFSSNQTQEGLVLDKIVDRTVAREDDSYYFVRMYIQKGTSKIKIKRQVQKLSSVFSYIGGFFGAITAGLFILNAYTNTSFEIALGFSIFSKKEESEQGNHYKNFNIFKYMWIKLVHLLIKCRMVTGNDKVNEVLQIQKQMNKQLDIKILLGRILKVEKMMTYLFERHELVAINLQNEISLSNVKQIRKLMRYQENVQEEGDGYHQNEMLTTQNFQISQQNPKKSLLKQKVFCEKAPSIFMDSADSSKIKVEQVITQNNNEKEVYIPVNFNVNTSDLQAYSKLDLKYKQRHLRVSQIQHIQQLYQEASLNKASSKRIWSGLDQSFKKQFSEKILQNKNK